MSTNNAVLVFPREIFNEVFSLLSWDSIQDRIEEIEDSFSWLARPEAESSEDVVQAIPCVLIRDEEGRCCVLKRVNEARKDLGGKLSLIVGGHIDYENEDQTFRDTVTINLLRELEEEVGVLVAEGPRPIGVIVDASSTAASRHVAFVHETTANSISPRAPEEFVSRSKFTGVFMNEGELAEKINEFDPWSRVLIEDYVCLHSAKPSPRQFSFV